eukprot:SAG31_NODE_4453_length_3218_cov_3.694453_2_plen_204_part_00
MAVGQSRRVSTGCSPLRASMSSMLTVSGTVTCEGDAERGAAPAMLAAFNLASYFARLAALLLIAAVRSTEKALVCCHAQRSSDQDVLPPLEVMLVLCVAFGAAATAAAKHHQDCDRQTRAMSSAPSPCVVYPSGSNGGATAQPASGLLGTGSVALKLLRWHSRSSRRGQAHRALAQVCYAPTPSRHILNLVPVHTRVPKFSSY